MITPCTSCCSAGSQLAVDRAHGNGDVLGLGEAGEARVEIRLEAFDLLLRRLEAGGGAVAVGLEDCDACRNLGALRLQRRKLTVHSLGAGACGLPGFGRRSKARVDLQRYAFAQRVELRRQRRFKIGELTADGGELRQPSALRVALGGGCHQRQLFFQLGDAGRRAGIAALGAELVVHRSEAFVELALLLGDAIDVGIELFELGELGLGSGEAIGYVLQSERCAGRDLIRA